MKYVTIVLFALLASFATLANAQQQCCENDIVVLTADSDTITCLNYTNDQNCTWVILPQNDAIPITLVVSSINTEEGEDTLSVYDGPTTMFPQLLQVSGTNPGNPVFSSEPRLTVNFLSDGSNDGGNFTFSYASASCLPETWLTAQTFSIGDGSGDQKYLPSLDCAWAINSTIAVDQVTLYFDYLNLDPAASVAIYDGLNTDAPLLGVYGNKTHYDPIVATSGNAAVHFLTTTGATKPYQGFNLTYTAGFCQDFVELGNANGSFTDGSGNQNYFNDLKCNWLLTPSMDSADIITLFVATINTEQGEDVLTIYDGSSSSFPQLGQFTGNFSLGPVYTSSNQAFVTFDSDGSNTGDGFLIEYTTNSCLERVAWSAQTATFTDGSGRLNTTANCTWAINPVFEQAEVNLTTLFFTHVDLGAGDSISVYNAAGVVVATIPEGRYHTIDQITVPGSNLSVALTTVTGGEGFQVSYAGGTCLPWVLFTGANGTFTAGQGAGGDYANDLDCTFVISPNGTDGQKASVAVLFDFVDTEQGEDTVTVYDGPNDKFPQLAQLTGQLQKQGPYTATGNVLTVVFRSDGSNSGLGFSASYSVV
eukprot:TRINITY_DN483_c0_g1_i1.p1 TRINITY_DN483_c0_g1~~TRINITY_DN483_c0_g1_i1.p1  ORF type:complete len:634 (+),score=155.94 TRINITY_DN483_c0_g1_i1:130-1902(+)